MKIAVYTDEVHDDFVKACSIISDLGITDVCLRRVQSYNVANHPKPEFIDDILRFNGLKPVMLCTEIGCCPPSIIYKHEQVVDRAISLSKSLGTKFVRIQAGDSSEADPRGMTKWWLEKIDSLAAENKFTPLLETTSDSALSSAAVIAAAMSRYKSWGLLYDPANLIKRRSIDPFTSYWTLLSSRVHGVDASDFKDGVFVLPGDGDCKLAPTLSNYDGWVFLEPNIGARYKPLTQRDSVFKHCYSTLLCLLEGIRNVSEPK